MAFKPEVYPVVPGIVCNEKGQEVDYLSVIHYLIGMGEVENQYGCLGRYWRFGYVDDWCFVIDCRCGIEENGECKKYPEYQQTFKPPPLHKLFDQTIAPEKCGTRSHTR